MLALQQLALALEIRANWQCRTYDYMLSLLVGAWHCVRRHWSEGASRLLAFFGPFIVLVVGDGLTPHLEIPWHQLVHTLFGSAPLTVLYLLALRKWRPALTRVR